MTGESPVNHVFVNKNHLLMLIAIADERNEMLMLELRKQLQRLGWTQHSTALWQQSFLLSHSPIDAEHHCPSSTAVAANHLRTHNWVPLERHRGQSCYVKKKLAVVMQDIILFQFVYRLEKAKKKEAAFIVTFAKRKQEITEPEVRTQAGHFCVLCCE
ncbi:hypothetical protein RHMOL_Rhmol01G0103600 [Rhododendron molle]|uniref:Uncharacterized protein n=1 Tax=Rhododendron molle TaxID=49168 RepID=A0ACC0Q1C2_RHOML|nr:hypothetical protein RHMOL_Rhmol01G0103600 [Rhododendron molle]